MQQQKVDVICSVLKSDTLAIPLFQCSYVPNNTDPNNTENPSPITISSTNPTKTVNKLMKNFREKLTHKWSGNDFFGFRRNVLKQIASNVPGKSNNNDCVISWEGVISYGVPIIDDRGYIFSSGTNSLRLQPGFESVRCINNSRKIRCKILKTDVGPHFRCETEDGTYFCQSQKPTVAMNELFKKLIITKTRNRSGYQFFGFNRSDVLNVIKAPYISYNDPINHTKTQ